MDNTFGKQPVADLVFCDLERVEHRIEEFVKLLDQRLMPVLRVKVEEEDPNPGHSELKVFLNYPPLFTNFNDKITAINSILDRANAVLDRLEI